MDEEASIEAAEAALRDEFELLDEPRDKIEHIIDLGRALPPLSDALKVDGNRVRGCQSQVWLVAELAPETGRISLRADSDAIISKGLVALVLRLYASRTAAEILAHPPDVFETIGLGRLVTPGRSNGLYAMVSRVQELARAFATARPAPASGP